MFSPNDNTAVLPLYDSKDGSNIFAIIFLTIVAVIFGEGFSCKFHMAAAVKRGGNNSIAFRQFKYNEEYQAVIHPITAADTVLRNCAFALKKTQYLLVQLYHVFLWYFLKHESE